MAFDLRLGRIRLSPLCNASAISLSASIVARVCKSSCLDQCATGVTVLVEPDHFFYGAVTVADVPEIVDGLVKGKPVKRLVVTADQL